MVKRGNREYGFTQVQFLMVEVKLYFLVVFIDDGGVQSTIRYIEGVNTTRCDVVRCLSTSPASTYKGRRGLGLQSPSRLRRLKSPLQSSGRLALDGKPNPSSWRHMGWVVRSMWKFLLNMPNLPN